MEWLNAPGPILTEAGVSERLCRRKDLVAHGPATISGLVYEPAGREALADIYKEYLAVAQNHGLPMLLAAPTWRANPQRLAAAGLDGRPVNRDCVAFLRSIIQQSPWREKTRLTGLMGPQGDAYRPEEALPEAEAAAFHQTQARALAEAGVDLLLAATLPARSEAVGLARAMAKAGPPYVVSLIIQPDGRLLDQTPLAELIEEIDAAVSPKPAGYMVNCVYPAVLEEALAGPAASVRSRVVGLQGNASAKPPHMLDGSAQTQGEPPEVFARDAARLHTRYGLKVLGGCCGTDARHLQELAGRLVGEAE